MAQKVVYWLLIVLIISLGFGQLLRFEFYSVPIYLHDLLVICILLLQGQTLKVRNFDLRGLALMGAGLAVSSLYALTHYPLSSLLIPSLYMFRLLAYITLYFVIKRSKIMISSKFFCISAFVSLFIGLSQYFLLPDMRWAQYLGWDDHLSRLTLPHFDPTFSGVMFGLFLLSNIKVTILPTITFKLLTILGILLTYSRSVWISLVVTSMFFIKKRIILLGTVCCLLLAIYALPQRFGEGTNLLRTYSISSRFDSDIAYIQKYKWDLLLGRGMNTLILDSGDSQYDNHATGPNNSFLYLLTTTGILGLLGWGIFMYSLYSKSTFKPMLIFFFIASLFNNVMFYPFALLWVFLLHGATQKNT